MNKPKRLHFLNVICYFSSRVTKQKRFAFGSLFWRLVAYLNLEPNSFWHGSWVGENSPAPCLHPLCPALEMRCWWELPRKWVAAFGDREAETYARTPGRCSDPAHAPPWQGEQTYQEQTHALSFPRLRHSSKTQVLSYMHNQALEKFALTP